VGALHAVHTIRPAVPIASALTVRGYLRATGGFSGGTWHSALGIFAEPRRRGGSEPKRDPSGRVVRALDKGPHFEPEVKAWALPMPTIDPWIVRRSARAMEVYGPSFSNGHFVCTRSLAGMVGTVAAVGAVVGLAKVPAARALLGRLKKPGEGPSPEQRQRARFSITFIAEGGGKRAITRVSGGDPGYDETAKMIAESALALARDREALPLRWGALSPAAAIGDRLLVRLPAAGMRFDVIEGPSDQGR
jgi:short subunit dehydrogenase-like uncharacterized protein